MKRPVLLILLALVVMVLRGLAATQAMVITNMTLVAANGVSLTLLPAAPLTEPTFISVEAVQPPRSVLSLGEKVSFTVQYRVPADTRLKLMRTKDGNGIACSGTDVMCHAGTGTVTLGWFAANAPAVLRHVTLLASDAATIRRIRFATDIRWQGGATTTVATNPPSFVRCPVASNRWVDCMATMLSGKGTVTGMLAIWHGASAGDAGTVTATIGRASHAFDLASVPPLALSYYQAMQPLPAASAAAAPQDAPTHGLLATGVPPPKCSLRPAYEKYGIDVRDQGRRGSCLIFGTLNPLEFHHAQRGQNERLSERFTIWAANTFRGRIDGNEEYTVAEVIGGIRQYGYTTEEVYRLKYKDHGTVGRPSEKALEDAAQRANVEVSYFGSSQGIAMADIQNMCTAIASSNPVALCLNWPDKIKFGSGKLIKPWKKSKGGHAVVAVGYVLDKRLPGGGKLEVRNSWGDNWGDDGYAFISFELFAEEGLMAFAIRPGKTP